MRLNVAERRVAFLLSAGAAVFLFTGTPEAQAVPYFARKHAMDCTACHSVPPKLNYKGEAFLARGYRLPPELEHEKIKTVPLAAWVTSRYEDQISRDFAERFLNRVELISGGPIAALPVSYFIEWRIENLETRSDGSLRDRSGRFEDAFINWEVGGRNSVRVGQFRSLNQVDVSRRLSLSEPVLLSASLPGEPSTDARIQSLRAFSPSGRSPGLSFQYQSIKGEEPSDGLFHIVTLPFVGELTLPLTPEAHQEASFELQGPPKGVFLETFYRQSLNSLGIHAFVDDDRWLLSGLGILNLQDFHLTGGVGRDRREVGPNRMRYSAEIEYLPGHFRRARPGAGFRVEHLNHSGREPAFIPYIVMSAPNTSYSFLVQLEYRRQRDNDAFLVDLSILF